MAAGRKTGGRQKGVPNKATASVKAAAQEFTTDALDVLAAIMRGAKHPAAARVAAAQALLDRGHGKPTQAVEVDANVKAKVTTIRRTVVDPRHPDA